MLFLPFKLKANTTAQVIFSTQMELFLPFKLKANTTLNPLKTIYDRLFLPFKLKANTTDPKVYQARQGCFYLSN